MRRAFILLATVAAALGAAPASKGDFILSSNIPTGYTFAGSDINVGYAGAGISNEASAQEFTAAASGRIARVTVSVDTQGTPNLPLIVSLFNASGTSIGSFLGSVAVPAANASPPYNFPGATGLTTADFSGQAINLAAGQHYFVELTTSAPLSTGLYRSLTINTPNSLAFGYQPLFSPNGGASFTPSGITTEIGVTVTGAAAAVPEPASAALVASGLAVAGLVVRRRRPR